VATGEAFSDTQLRDISHAVNTASDETGLQFSVFVGSPEGASRKYAERLHAGLGDRAAYGVLVLVAPAERALEIVTGPEAAPRVPDRSCALAALSMRSAFLGGDLFGGIVTGVRMMAESAGSTRAIAQSGGATRGGTVPSVVEHAGH